VRGVGHMTEVTSMIGLTNCSEPAADR
jgi:hypothetical protein